MPQIQEKPLRIGIIGFGEHCKKVIVPALSESKSCKLQLIATNNPNKIAWINNSLANVEVISSYEQLLESPLIEAVFIALPNSMHTEWSNKALEQGKHVLCEKPAAISSKDVLETCEIARKKSLIFREAFMYRSHPQHQVVKKLIAEGQIGAPQLFEACFHYYLEDSSNIRLNKELGGGSLLDVGCYLTDAMRLVFSDSPTAVSGTSKVCDKTGVDENTFMQFYFEGGRAANLSCSTKMPRANHYTIYGEQGKILVRDAFRVPRGKRTIVELFNSKGKSEIFKLEPFNQYTAMLDCFAELAQGGNDSGLLEDAQDNSYLLDFARKACLSGQKVYLPSL